MVPADSATTPATPSVGEVVYDREFVFLSFEADSLVLVPWFFRARSASGVVHHEQAAWLARSGEWETLGREAHDGPTTRFPWRVLPGESIRLIVGPEERVRSLLLRDPPRELETVLGDLMTEWANPGFGAVRMFRSRTLFPSGEVPGVVIDVSRRWEPSERTEPGDWMFLHSGQGVQLFMEGESAHDGPGAFVSYRGWTRVALRDLRWPELRAEWDEVRPYEAARRDVPTRWSFSTPDGEVEGSIEATSSNLLVAEGTGPILPLVGLFEVSGVLSVEGEEFPVVGFVRHGQ